MTTAKPATKATRRGTSARPAAAPPGSPVAYLLHIELRDARPKIWRQVWVDPAITLRKLHAVVQAAMGWHDAHLYGFAVPGPGRAGRYWGAPNGQRFELAAARDGDLFDVEPSNDDARQPLNGLLHAPKDKLLYLYDFGDDWEHVITLAQIQPDAEPRPRLTGAGGGCPPEDCGGVPGFEQLRDDWNNPDFPDRAELLDWLAEMGVAGEPGSLDEAGWQALAKSVARLQPKPRAKPGPKPAAKRRPGSAV